MRGLGADSAYWQALAENRFVMQQCAGCGRWHWPAVWRCADCGSWEQRWLPLALDGHVYSWTRSWHDFGAPPEFGLPYTSVVVELLQAPGCRVLGTLSDREQEARIGARVLGRIDSVALGDERLPMLRWQTVDPA